MTTQRKKTTYYVENICGGNEQFSSLSRACAAAISWGNRGTIEDKKGVRHVAQDLDGDGYQISEYGADGDVFMARD